MADIIPFKALRPREDLVEKIAALPYDVYDRREAREKVAGDTLSFLRIDRPETQFPEDYDMYAPEVYEKAREMLREMIKRGEFVTEDAPAYYVYELVMNGRSQTGICACAWTIMRRKSLRNMRTRGRRRKLTESVMWISVMHRPDQFF